METRVGFHENVAFSGTGGGGWKALFQTMYWTSSLNAEISDFSKVVQLYNVGKHPFLVLVLHYYPSHLFPIWLAFARNSVNCNSIWKVLKWEASKSAGKHTTLFLLCFLSGQKKGSWHLCRAYKKIICFQFVVEVEMLTFYL